MLLNKNKASKLIELLKKSAGVKSEFDPQDEGTEDAEKKNIPNQVASDDEPLE